MCGVMHMELVVSVHVIRDALAFKFFSLLPFYDPLFCNLIKKLLRFSPPSSFLSCPSVTRSEKIARPGFDKDKGNRVLHIIIQHAERLRIRIF